MAQKIEKTKRDPTKKQTALSWKNPRNRPVFLNLQPT